MENYLIYHYLLQSPTIKKIFQNLPQNTIHLEKKDNYVFISDLSKPCHSRSLSQFRPKPSSFYQLSYSSTILTIYALERPLFKTPIIKSLISRSLTIYESARFLCSPLPSSLCTTTIFVFFSTIFVHLYNHCFCLQPSSLFSCLLSTTIYVHVNNLCLCPPFSFHHCLRSTTVTIYIRERLHHLHKREKEGKIFFFILRLCYIMKGKLNCVKL